MSTGLGAAALILSACTGGAPPSAPPRGLILISIDTLRDDHLHPEITPTLAALAERSTRFTHTWSQANETLFSHGSMFTSRLPSRLGALDYDWTIPEGTPTLASALAEAGWRTGAVVGGGHLARVFGLDDGFDDYVEGQRWGSFQETVPMGLRWLDRAAAGEAPFFLFLHSYDVHAPYTKPGVFGRLSSPGYEGPLLEPSGVSLFYEQLYGDTWFPDFPLTTVTNRAGTRVLTPEVHRLLPAYAARGGVRRVPLSADDRAWLDGLYDDAAFYADQWIAVLLAELERRGLADTTAIAVVSDHGEGLREHGFQSHRGELLDSSTRVPFVLHMPGEAPREVDEVATLLDVAPTLLSWAGVPAPPELRGRDLLPCAVGGACPGDGVAVSEAALEMTSITDGALRLTVSGAPVRSGAMDALIQEAAAGAPGVVLSDSAGGPAADEAALERLRGALLRARERL